MISPNDIVACICEGNSEKNILSLLLEQNKLIFTKEQLLDDQIFQGKYRNPKNFCDQYLTMDYEESKIVILVILDKIESYAINAPYSHKVRDKHLIVTSPESEMLMIHSAGLYDEYQKEKSKKKPSEFLAEKWKMSSSKIKSKQFIETFYSENSLVDAIKEHSEKAKKDKKYSLLNDFIKE